MNGGRVRKTQKTTAHAFFFFRVRAVAVLYTNITSLSAKVLDKVSSFGSVRARV